MKLLSINILISTARRLKKDGWKFDWEKSFGAVSQKIAFFDKNAIQGLAEFEEVPSSRYNIIYRIELAPENIGKNRKIENVAGMLFAYVAKDSLDAGFDGFVVFDSKTILKDHYVNKYGAKILYGDRLYFDTKASRNLVNRYLKGKNCV
ncbi:MAG: hypothetical protein LBJ25_05545 [Candidatus Margulisbacteria bacterium]|jgi:hypothetical protein|nr:hypothetical protein [Candidatus Margulisiibacteriota bacterium]